MRKTSKLLSMVLLLFAFFSCDDDEQADQLSFSESVLRFTNESDRISLIVESNVPFEQIRAKSVADWIQVEALQEGHQFVVTVPANPNPDVRQAVIVFEAGNCVKEIDVLQEAQPIDLALTAETGKCWDLNTQIPIGIKTKEMWTATASGDWFHLSETSGVGNACIYAWFEPNTTSMERRGEVKVTLKNGTERNFSFVQSAALPDLGREGDSLALAAIYHKFNGAKNWTIDSRWCEPGVPLERWVGVIVNRTTKRVEYLYLTQDFKCEGGDFPEEIRNLTALTQFKSINNGYNGKLPYDLLRCSKLQWFVLKGCSVQGTLEPWLGSFGYLRVMDFNSAGLSGELLYELQTILALQDVDLGSNNFTGEIPSCWNMEYLNNLNLSYNSLSGEVPENIGEMPRLSSLLLMGNTDMVGKLPDNFCLRHQLGYVYRYDVTDTGIEVCKKE